VQHPGRDKVLAMMKRKFYWHGMKRDLEAYISFCEHCQKDRGRGITAPLEPIVATYVVNFIL